MDQADNSNASVANNTGAITATNLSILCQGYGGQDTANITNIGVHCGMLLGLRSELTAAILDSQQITQPGAKIYMPA